MRRCQLDFYLHLPPSSHVNVDVNQRSPAPPSRSLPASTTCPHSLPLTESREQHLAELGPQIAGGKATVEAGILTLSSGTEGSSSQVEVTGGTANPTLGFATGVVSGTGNVADLGAVSVSEVTSAVEAAIPSVEVTAGVGGVIELRTLGTGAAVSLQVQPATAVAFGFDNDLHSGSDSGAADAVRVEGKDPGAYADQIQAEVRAATSGEAEAFDLAVIEDGVYRETFPNLSMQPTAERYIERIVNDVRLGSVLIRVIDQLLAGHPVPDVQTV